MKEFKGTPGPWVVDANVVQARWNIDDAKGNSVALTHQLPGDKDWQKRDANTHLIAAAPELLEALQDALHAYDKHGEYPEWDFARAVIKKAMGE